MWPPTLTPCECRQPGWCERHQCLKPSALHLLCRRNQDYYDAWERGEGPCLSREGLPMERPAVPEGTGDGLEPTEARDPGLVQRAMNLGRAVVRHVVDGGQHVDDATYESRLAVCHSCPSCDTAHLICREPTCGCYLPIKARWRSEDCPLRQWPAVPGSETQT